MLLSVLEDVSIGELVLLDFTRMLSICAILINSLHDIMLSLKSGLMLFL